MDPETQRLYEQLMGSRSTPGPGPGAAPTAAPKQDLQSAYDAFLRSRSLEGQPNPRMQDMITSAMAGPVGAGEAGLPPSAYVDMPRGEYWGRVGGNVLPSAGRAIVDTAKALTVNLPETATGVYQLGRGLTSKAAGAMGFEQDPVEKAQTEAVADAIGQRYASTYAGEPGSFWKALAEDPAAIGMDVASVAPVLGVAGKGSTLGRAGRLAENLDPTQAALNVAGKAIPAVGQAIPKGVAAIQSKASGVDYGALMTVRDAFLSNDPARRQAVMSAMRNEVDAKQFVDQLVGGVDDLERAASERYMNDAANAFSISQPVPMSGPVSSAGELYNLLRPSALRQNVYYNPSDENLARTALNAILAHATDPRLQTVKELDVLKKELDRIAGDIRNPSLQGRVSGIAGSIIEATKAVDPTYAKMMSDWSNWKRDLKNIQKEFGTTAMSDAQRAKKIMAAMSNPDRIVMLNRIADTTEGGKYLRETAAGRMTSPIASDKFHTLVSGAGGPLTAAMFFGTHPAAMLLAAPGLMASSPRLGGLSQAAMAGAQRVVNPMVEGVRRTALTAPVTNVAGQFGEAQTEAEERMGRKSGGRVGIDHGREADSLIMAAERARKQIGQSTQAILHTPDEHVVNALEIANRSI